MLDINLFREDKGNDPERVRESQRRWGAPVELVDEVIRLDKAWRQRQFELDCIRKDFNQINKEIAQLKIIRSTEENKKLTVEKTEEVLQAKAELESKLMTIGNLVHDFVPVSLDEVNNQVVKIWGERRLEGKLMNHVELVEKLGIANMKKGMCGLISHIIH